MCVCEASSFNALQCMAVHHQVHHHVANILVQPWMYDVSAGLLNPKQALRGPGPTSPFTNIPLKGIDCCQTASSRAASPAKPMATPAKLPACAAAEELVASFTSTVLPSQSLSSSISGMFDLYKATPRPQQLKTTVACLPLRAPAATAALAAAE